MESETKTFRCVVHINRQVEVFIDAEDEKSAIEQAEDLSVFDLTHDENYMDDDPVVKKCEVV